MGNKHELLVGITAKIDKKYGENKKKYGKNQIYGQGNQEKQGDL